MSQPNFRTMSRSALIAYLLEHRDDQQAFEALMDKLAAEPVLATLPPFSSEQAEDFAKLLSEVQQKRNQRSAS